MAAKRRNFLLLFFATMALGSGVIVGVIIEHAQEEWERSNNIIPIQHQFTGPGSFPPTCRARCGRCYPCRALYIAIQPGDSMTLEYYPEAWRCKCRNKLFMP